MRVGINLLHAIPEIGGGWNYIKNLVQAIALYDRENDYIAYCNPVSAEIVPDTDNFQKIIFQFDASSRIRRVINENVQLQILAKHHGLACMFWMGNTHGLINVTRSLVIIYDLQSIRPNPQFSIPKKIYLGLNFRKTIRRATHLLPMSQSVAAELTQYFGIPQTGMTVVPPILDAKYHRSQPTQITEFRQKYGLPERFWLYVAHLYPHKNHIRLLQAYKRLKKMRVRHWPLALRGDPGGAEDEIKKMISEFNLENDVIWIPRLRDSEMPILYSAATALVFPSLYEGGGIPILEAMACGCPILASDIPPIKEFAATVPHYFDPMSVDKIAEAMIFFLTHEQEFKKKTVAGMERVQEFYGQHIIEKLTKTYRAIGCN